MQCVCLCSILKRLKFTSYLLVLALVSFYSAANQTVTFCSEAKQYPPYISVDQYGNPSGLLVDIVKKSAKEVGLTANFITDAWLRCQKLVTENKAQALFAMIKTSQRAQTFQFPADSKHYIAVAEYPIFYTENSVIHQHLDRLFSSGKFSPTAFLAIKNYGLQAPLGYVAQEYITRHGLNSSVDYTVDEGLKMAALGRLDGYIVERNIGLARAELLALKSKLKTSNQAVIKQDWFVPFNKQYYQQHKSIIDKFWLQVAKNRIE
ncbi:substrate-binding periplasmic protein [Colwellia sp. MEBiC06753]